MKIFLFISYLLVSCSSHLTSINHQLINSTHTHALSNLNNLSSSNLGFQNLNYDQNTVNKINQFFATAQSPSVINKNINATGIPIATSSQPIQLTPSPYNFIQGTQSNRNLINQPNQGFRFSNVQPSTIYYTQPNYVLPPTNRLLLNNRNN